jgi:endonuclease/exonuclease/phosphatase family metal-dependent hydrolase
MVEARGAGGGSSTITLLTWNVWSAETPDTDARMDAVLGVLAREAPTIAALHEVTPRFLGRLLDDASVRGRYVCSETEPSAIGEPTSIMLAPPGARLSRVDLPSERGRLLVIAALDTPAGVLRVGGTHLESQRVHERERAEQYAIATRALGSRARGEAAVLMGDLNFCATWPENARVRQPWQDLWPQLHPGDPGWTQDSARNPMVAARKGARQVRFDRVLLRDEREAAARWRASELRLLGTEPFDPARPGLRASDHFGLFARLEARALLATRRRGCRDIASAMGVLSKLDAEGRPLRRTLGIAHLGGATLDNEENYLIKKLFSALGIVQIENQARM